MMGTTTKRSSDREKWDKVFDGLVKLLKNQQEQLETLAKERKILEDRIKMQQERWISDIRLYEDHIFQMKDNLVGKEMALLLESAKLDLMAGLKQREASIHKLKLEQTEDELADFRAWFDFLSHNLKRNSKDSDNGKEGGRRSNSKSAGSKGLEDEVKTLKLEYEKLASEKSSEISALLHEKSFVWHQYNALESNLTDKLKSKQAEVELANYEIAKVLASVEQLQSSNNEKDETIGTLKAKVFEMEVNTNKWKDEIAKLSQELELLRKSKSAQVTPVFKCCNRTAETSNLGVKNSSRDGSNIVVKKELSSVKAVAPLKDNEKGSRSLKRKGIDVITISETPKLFSSTFKVPKLKLSSAPVR